MQSGSHGRFTFFFELLVVSFRPAAVDQRCRVGPRRDADDADAVVAELGGDVLDQADDGGLGGGIGVTAAATHRAGDASGNRGGAAPLLAIWAVPPPSPARRAWCPGERRARQDSDRFDGDLGDQVEGPADAGVEIGDVEVALPILRRSDGCRHVGLLVATSQRTFEAVAMPARLGDRQRLPRRWLR